MPTTTSQSAPPAAAQQTGTRADNLALIFQEPLTVVERLRADRQAVTNSETFRAQFRHALKTSEADALRRGYGAEDVNVAIFAVVAFLDESILNSQKPIFIDWPRKPLQEEMFGVHVAGEIFFRNLDRLLSRQDSEPVADLLEVHQLCLLLGFRGRYSYSGMGEIRTYLQQVEEKIRRIRNTAPNPGWQIQAQTILPARDRWIPILRWVAIGCVVLACLLFVIYKMSLSSSAQNMRSVAAVAGQ